MYQHDTARFLVVHDGIVAPQQEEAGWIERQKAVMKAKSSYSPRPNSIPCDIIYE
jgi:hypothetical protein